MITIANYNEKKGSLDFSKYPDAIKEIHGNMDKYLRYYSKSDKIKDTVDLYLKNLNKLVAEKEKAKNNAPKPPPVKETKPPVKENKPPVKENKAKAASEDDDLNWILFYDEDLRVIRNFLLRVSKTVTLTNLKNFLKSIEMMMAEGKISKKSEFVKEVTTIKEKVNSMINQMIEQKVDQAVVNAKSDFIEKLNKIKADNKIKTSVAIIKTYLGFRGSETKEKCKNMIKRIDNSKKAKKIKSNDKFIKEINLIYKRCESFLSDSTKSVQPTVDLRGLGK